jgi:hypothetical protein
MDLSILAAPLQLPKQIGVAESSASRPMRACAVAFELKQVS